MTPTKKILVVVRTDLAMVPVQLKYIDNITKKHVNLEFKMSDVKLNVNENEIPLKEFMGGMLTNLILGYLKSAKGIPEKVEKIKIEIIL